MCFVLSMWKGPHTILQLSGKDCCLLFTNSSLPWARDAATSRDLLPTLFENVIPASKRGAEKGNLSHSEAVGHHYCACLVLVSQFLALFVFLSSISLLGYLAQPLSALSGSCPKRLLFTYLIAVRIKGIVSQESSKESGEDKKCKTPRGHVCKSLTSTPAAV